MTSNLGEPYETIDLRKYGVPIKEAIKQDPVLNSLADENGKIDLGDPSALREYNRFVFRKLANIDVFIPEGFLIPTAGLRIKTAEIITNLVLRTKKSNALWKGIEVGVGATAINSMLLAKKGFNMIGTEIDEESLFWANKNLIQNNLAKKVKLVKSSGEILLGLPEIENSEFDFVLTFPPYYDPRDTHLVYKDRGFQGREKELVGGKEGIEFANNFLKEAKELQISFCFVMLDKASRAEKVIKKGNSLGWEMHWINFIAGTRKRFLVFGKNPAFINLS